jgi:hypothetical protein
MVPCDNILAGWYAIRKVVELKVMTLLGLTLFLDVA